MKRVLLIIIGVLVTICILLSLKIYIDNKNISSISEKLASINETKSDNNIYTTEYETEVSEADTEERTVNTDEIEYVFSIEDDTETGIQMQRGVEEVRTNTHIDEKTTANYEEQEVKTESIESETEQDDGLKLLVIGNSIAAHKYTPPGTDNGYWLQDWGLGASSRDKDYVHLLGHKLGISDDNISVVNLADWEFAGNKGLPRSNYLGLIDTAFSNGEQYDYVVIQLGESCMNSSTLYNDCQELYNYINEKNNNPDAKFLITGTIVVMDLEKNSAADYEKLKFAMDNGILYVDMHGYDESMWVGEGTQIVNEKGEVTVISLEQRTHPGDYGMQWIADKIYDAMVQNELIIDKGNT